jgi:hypothetical protein
MSYHLGGTCSRHYCKRLSVFLSFCKCSRWLITVILMPLLFHLCQFIICAYLVQSLHTTHPEHLNLSVMDRNPKLTAVSHLMICEVGTAVTSGEISKHCWTNFSWYWCWWWKAREDLKLWKSSYRILQRQTAVSGTVAFICRWKLKPRREK